MYRWHNHPAEDNVKSNTVVAVMVVVEEEHEQGLDLDEERGSEKF